MARAQRTRPRIGDGDNEIEPVVMRAEYQLPWNRQSSQTACGQIIQNQVGDENWRITIEGVMTKEQMQQLDSMRGLDTVPVVTEEFGQLQVAFDTLTVTRADEEKWGEIEGYTGPFLSFQLQTKEDEEDEGLF